MSVLQFSDRRAYKTLSTGEEARIGSFQVQNSIYLRHTRLGIYINDFALLSGSEQITQKIYTDFGYTNLIATSSPSSLSNIDWDGSKPGFLGFFRIDWDYIPMNEKLVYYFAAEISGYTRTSDFYVALNWDFPDSIYDSGGSRWDDFPIAMQIFGLAER